MGSWIKGTAVPLRKVGEGCRGGLYGVGQGWQLRSVRTGRGCGVCKDPWIWAAARP